MIADLKPYAEYKESGLPWLGRVPGHWDTRQARHIGRLLKGVGGTKEDAVAEGLPCVRYGELYTTYKSFIRTTKTFIKPDRAPDYMPIHFGDVLFAASGEKIEEIGKSAVNLMKAPAVCGGDVIVLRPSIPVHAPYLGYALDCHPAANQKSTMGRGTTIKHIYPDELRGLIVILPPPAEQAAIVRFLDWANGRLERAIRAKRKVIALLSEQKQAIIHRAVTRSLDPSVPLKPSGTPWLGDIPQHWEVRKLKHTVDNYGPGIQMGPFGSSLTNLQTSDTGFKLFGQENTISGDFTRGGRWITAGQFDGLRKYELVEGDIVLTRKGSIGKARLVPDGVQHGIADSDTVRVRIDSRVASRAFIVQLLHSATYVQRQLEATRRGAVLGGLNTATIGNLVLALPPLREQTSLLNGLREETKDVDAAINRIEREIELLREYRTRLVADVVTGKLDVRAAAAKLPEESDDLEPFDGADTLTEGDEDTDGEALDTVPEETES